MCYYSDDYGKSWLASNQVPNPDNIVLQEPGIVELEDGKVMLFCRTDTGLLYFSQETLCRGSDTSADKV